MTRPEHDPIDPVQRMLGDLPSPPVPEALVARIIAAVPNLPQNRPSGQVAAPQVALAERTATRSLTRNPGSGQWIWGRWLWPAGTAIAAGIATLMFLPSIHPGAPATGSMAAIGVPIPAERLPALAKVEPADEAAKAVQRGAPQQFPKAAQPALASGSAAAPMVPIAAPAAEPVEAQSPTASLPETALASAEAAGPVATTDKPVLGPPVPDDEQAYAAAPGTGPLVNSPQPGFGLRGGNTAGAGPR